MTGCSVSAHSNGHIPETAHAQSLDQRACITIRDQVLNVHVARSTTHTAHMCQMRSMPDLMLDVLDSVRPLDSLSQRSDRSVRNGSGSSSQVDVFR